MPIVTHDWQASPFQIFWYRHISFPHALVLTLHRFITSRCRVGRNSSRFTADVSLFPGCYCRNGCVIWEKEACQRYVSSGVWSVRHEEWQPTISENKVKALHLQIYRCPAQMRPYEDKLMHTRIFTQTDVLNLCKLQLKINFKASWRSRQWQQSDFNLRLSPKALLIYFFL